MYDMYPQAWALDEGPMGGAPERPRRRPRKAHSVVPAVIARQLAAGDVRPSLG
ncbi:hypothetical protein [uncultured Friedmanniella sp.]|uniref:hypothetical protein n=1 Tax=uncultured Friedmanniella sp. TaxID=335381 RepID=UPI0035CA297A